MGEGPGLSELAFRLVGSLALVVGLLFLIARLVNRRMRPSQGAAVQVVARQQLTRAAGVAVVAVGSRVLVVGTTEHQVSLLAELEPDELLDDELDATPTGQYLSGTQLTGTGLTGTTAAAAPGPLTGSVLSPQTWKQTLALFSGGPAEDRRGLERPEDPPDAQRPAS